MIPSVEAARVQLRAAQERLEAAAAAAYPRDMIVIAELGGYKIELIVIRMRGATWHSPGEIMGRNTKTGKIRAFYDHNVIRIKHDPTKRCTIRFGSEEVRP